MKNKFSNWSLTESTTAKNSDLFTAKTRAWNKENPLPSNFWQRIWEYPWILERSKNFSSQLDVGGTYPFVLFKSWPNAKSVDSRNLNLLDHELHKGKWPEGKLIVADATDMPIPDRSYDMVMCISSLEEMHHPDRVLSEIFRIANKRVILTIDVGGNGLDPKIYEQLFFPWNLKSPSNKNLSFMTSLSPAILFHGQRLKWVYRKIRVVGLVFDRID